MRVKLFTKSNPNAQRGMRDDELELEINTWLDKHPTVEITNVSQSCSARGEIQELTVCVWYKTTAELAAGKLNRNTAETGGAPRDLSKPPSGNENSSSTAP